MSISKKIIGSVVSGMKDNVQDMGDVVIIPNTFDVHIHTDDFKTVRPFLRELREQTIKRLDGEIDKRSKNSAEQGRLASALKRLLGFEVIAGHKEYRRVEDHWDINFHECHGKVRVNDQVFALRRGEVCTISNFSSSRQPSLNSQFGTIATIYPVSDSSSPPYTDESQLSTVEMERAGGEGGPASAPYFATLEYKYKDSSEWHTYRMVKERITVGRASRDGAIDLPLTRDSDLISTEHLEIRVEVEAGKFLLRSLGRFGTAVNGSKVPDGGEVELRDGARIALAGGEVIIDFSIPR